MKRYLTEISRLTKDFLTSVQVLRLKSVQLARKGFPVTGSDISKSAIYRAMEVYANEPNVVFVIDNILDSRLKDDDYEYIFDRGCFHVFQPSDRTRYVKEIKRILKDNGMLFLKCFSIEEKRDEGPYKFSKIQISQIFEKEAFKIERIKETVYTKVRSGSAAKGIIHCAYKS